MKRTLILIGCTMIAALAALIMLVAFAGMPNDRKNGFDRQWLTVKVEQEHSEELPLPAERIFGAGDSLYLSEPLHQSIYRLDQDLHIRDTVYLDVNKQLKPPVSFFATSSHIYVHEHNSGKLYEKDINVTMFDSVKLSEGPYVKSLQLSDSLVVIRGFIPGSFQPQFVRINLYGGEQLRGNVLSEKADAGFSSDGILCCDKQREHLFYIPYFENGIYCMDRGLQLLYKQQTIDTVFNSGIQVTKRVAGETQKLYASAPRAKVNKRAFANDKRLFIESDLQADNEQEAAFRKSPVMDTYDIKDGKYTGSFYLPVDKSRVLSYYINGEKLYVLLKDQIISYVVNLP